MSESRDEVVETGPGANSGCVVVAVAALMLVALPVVFIGEIARSKCGMYAPGTSPGWLRDAVDFGTSSYSPLWLPLVVPPITGLIGKKLLGADTVDNGGIWVGIAVVVVWDFVLMAVGC